MRAGPCPARFVSGNEKLRQQAAIAIEMPNA